MTEQVQYNEGIKLADDWPFKTAFNGNRRMNKRIDK